MKNSFLYSLFLSGLMLSACASTDTSVKETDKQVQAAQSADITKPPSLEVNNGDVQAEQNPDETVSFRRWREEQSKQTSEAK